MDDLNFIKVSRENLLNFIDEAKERIIVAKPGFFIEEVSKILGKAKNQKLEVRLYVEEGDQAIRFGFGDEKALELIMKI